MKTTPWLYIFSICFLLACQPTPTTFSYLEQTEDGVSFYIEGQPVLSYHFSPQMPPDSLPDYYQRSGFIHPLFSPSGKVLTDGFPEGHTHQHGVFHAFTKTTYQGQAVDFWNQQHQTGTVRHSQINAWENLMEPGKPSFISTVNDHIAFIDGAEKVAFREQISLIVAPIKRYFQVDYYSTLFPGKDSLLVEQYKYGGFALRGSAEWNQPNFQQDEHQPLNFIGRKGEGGFLTSEGKTRIEGNHSRPNWVCHYGEIEGDTAGVVIMSHPSNHRSPQPVRIHPEMPYFCFAPMVTGGFSIQGSPTYQAQYRLITFDGAPNVAMLDSIWQDYIKDYRPPNILLIMADDLGYETLGCNGGTSYETPRLDRMAQEGMRFTQAYSTPLCTPSRVQIMTGKYNHRNYIGFGMLDSTENTFADYLKQQGYTTAIAGKWQLLGNSYQRERNGTLGSLPQQAGFDQHCVWQVEEKSGPRFKDPYLVIDGKADQEYKGEYGPDVFVDYLKKAMQDTDQPFFAYYPMALTHEPFRPTPDQEDYAIDSLHKGSRNEYFAANVSYMDKKVGELLDHLALNNLAENTLVLFVGDNGTDRRIQSEWEGQQIKGWKGYPLEAGTHVPMIAWWPEKIEAGTVNDNLIDFTDFLPTLLEVAGIARTDEMQLDGFSFYDQLLGRAYQTREWVYCNYNPNWGKFEPRTYVHDRQYKLYDNGDFYHFGADPLEERPLTATEMSAVQRARKKKFQQVMEELAQ